MCTDERFCCKYDNFIDIGAGPVNISQTVVNTTGCPVFVTPCSPDYSSTTLGWSTEFTWFLSTVIVASIVSAIHAILGYTFGEREKDAEDAEMVKSQPLLSVFSSPVNSNLATGAKTLNVPFASVSVINTGSKFNKNV